MNPKAIMEAANFGDLDGVQRMNVLRAMMAGGTSAEIRTGAFRAIHALRLPRLDSDPGVRAEGYGGAVWQSLPLARQQELIAQVMAAIEQDPYCDVHRGHDSQMAYLHLKAELHTRAQ